MTKSIIEIDCLLISEMKIENQQAFRLLGCLLLFSIFLASASAQYFEADTDDIDLDDDLVSMTG